MIDSYNVQDLYLSILKRSENFILNFSDTSYYVFFDSDNTLAVYEKEEIKKLSQTPHQIRDFLNLFVDCDNHISEHWLSFDSKVAQAQNVPDNCWIKIV